MVIPYSGKFWWGKTGKFGDLLQIRQNFIRQLLVIFEKAIKAGLKFAKSFFAECN